MAYLTIRGKLLSGSQTELQNNFAVDSGSVNTYVVSLDPPVTSLVAGFVIFFIPTNTNTGSCTLQVNGLSAISILNGGSSLAAGYLIASETYCVVYDGSNFQILSSGGGGSGGSGISGYSGASGTAGTIGISGYSGSNGTAGSTGISGYSGASGTTGISGYSGASGTSGISGYSGSSNGITSSFVIAMATVL